MKSRINKPQSNLLGEDILEDDKTRNTYIEPPFSVLDTKTGQWQKRKKIWAALGIKSEIGRDTKSMSGMHSFSGEAYGSKEKLPAESIFDPALCEVLYNWYCPQGGSILDCFAGGSVRGIVAQKLGFKYTGVDIRPEQIESNKEQGLEILGENNMPDWIIGDSLIEIPKIQKRFDLLFSCPPYADLEVYSDLKGDISNMPYKEFLEFYNEIIYESCKKVKPGGWAIFVVGEVRSKSGEYYNFVSDTISAFLDAGMLYYNEAILLNAIGTAMLRVGNTFDRGDKKLVKVHQNILIFKKPNREFKL